MQHTPNTQEERKKITAKGVEVSDNLRNRARKQSKRVSGLIIFSHELLQYLVYYRKNLGPRPNPKNLLK